MNKIAEAIEAALTAKAEWAKAQAAQQSAAADNKLARKLLGEALMEENFTSLGDYVLVPRAELSPEQREKCCTEDTIKISGKTTGGGG